MSCSYYVFRQGDYYCAKKQDYVNSDCYYRYCRNYSYDECPIYKMQDSSGGCYLTSACVEARGLPDDCHELQTLRAFRDGWLRQQEGGEAEIQAYYDTAPKIVSEINKRPHAIEIYKQLYERLVAPCVTLIEQQDMEGAYQRYRSVTLELGKHYL